MSIMIENSPCFSEESLEYMKSEVQEEICICWLGGTLRTFTCPPIKFLLTYILFLLFSCNRLFLIPKKHVCILLMVVCIPQWVVKDIWNHGDMFTSRRQSQVVAVQIWSYVTSSSVIIRFALIYLRGEFNPCWSYSVADLLGLFNLHQDKLYIIMKQYFACSRLYFD